MKVYVVTGNKGKLREFKLLGEELGIEVIQLNIPKIEVQAERLEDIAAISAQLIAPHVRNLGAVFVEDAGLFIKALKGFPGPYSSYVFKTIGVNGVLKLMEGVKDREAIFKSVIALVTCNHIKLFKGVVKGFIAEKARGSEGFGFDPIFIPEGHDRTLAEMGVKDKNRLSHRALAFKSMADWLRTAFKSQNL